MVKLLALALLGMLVCAMAAPVQPIPRESHVKSHEAAGSAAPGRCSLSMETYLF
jgi:hypothetical protein